MKPNFVKYLITFLKFAISIGVLWWLFHTASKEDEFANFFEREKKWGWVGLGFLAALMAHVIGFVRWRVMVRALGLPFTVWDAIRIGFIGVFFNIIAFGVIGGDSLRAFYVTRQVKNRTPEAIASVVADRIIGLLTMFTIASTMFLVLSPDQFKNFNPSELSLFRNVVLLISGAGYLGIFAIFCVPWISKSNWYQSLMKLPKVGGIIGKLTEVLMVYRSKPFAVAVSFLMSVGVNFCFVVSIYALAVGLTENYPSFANHFAIEPIAMVSNAAPLPGGIGAMEPAMNLLYETFGATSGVLVAFAFRFALLFVTAVGACFWFVNKSKVAEVMEASENSTEPT